jgi:hypothetical protein
MPSPSSQGPRPLRTGFAQLPTREKSRRIADVETALRAGDRDGAVRAAEQAVTGLVINRAAFVGVFEKLVRAEQDDRALQLLEVALEAWTSRTRWMLVLGALVVASGIVAVLARL